MQFCYYVNLKIDEMVFVKSNYYLLSLLTLQTFLKKQLSAVVAFPFIHIQQVFGVCL